jgi:heat shock protein HslJ
MNKKVTGFIVGLLAVVLIVVLILLNPFQRPANNPPAGEEIVADPQMLMIPRWFLVSLELDGEALDVPAGQQELTLQFESPARANGTGGCNTFGADFQADYDGSLSFGPVVSTRMFCEGKMDLENAYFQALSQVEQFRVAEGRLTLASGDGQVGLVFAMPPK